VQADCCCCRCMHVAAAAAAAGDICAVRVHRGRRSHRAAVDRAVADGSGGHGRGSREVIVRDQARRCIRRWHSASGRGDATEAWRRHPRRRRRHPRRRRRRRYPNVGAGPNPVRHGRGHHTHPKHIVAARALDPRRHDGQNGCGGSACQFGLDGPNLSNRKPIGTAEPAPRFDVRWAALDRPGTSSAVHIS
jgi:hypothetical protein